MRRGWTAVAVMLGLGILGAVAWSSLAEPSYWTVRSDGVFMTEEAARGQFQVVVMFLLVGSVLSFGWSVGVALLVRPTHWRLVPFVIAATLAAALVTWLLGMALGPGGPGDPSDLPVGTTVSEQLSVDSWSAFLVWPVCGLVALVAGLLFTGDDEVSDHDRRAEHDRAVSP